MKLSFILLTIVIATIPLCVGDAHARGFGGYHGGGFGGFHGGGLGGFSGGAAFRGYHGGFGAGGLYAGGYRGGYGLGYGRAIAGFDNYNRPLSRGIPGWRGELGYGGYANRGYSGIYRANPIRPSQYGALSRIPGYLYGPDSANFRLPTDFGFHQANRLEHPYGYLGNAAGLTAFAPAAEYAARPSNVRANAASIRTAEQDAVARNAAAVTRYWPDAALRARGHVIRNDVLAEAAFGPTWYDDYAGAWIAQNVVADLWTPAAWTTVNNWFGNNWPAIGYNYGDDLTYDNGNVNLYGVPMATAAEYYQAAANLAAQGEQEPPKSADWLPLGVFAAVRGEEKNTDMLFQLAVDKDGAVRGNYFNTKDKNVQYIEGAVDRKTQRISWIVADRPNIVFDTGAYNLTKQETPVLVHFSKDKTEPWTLVRLRHENNAPIEK